MRGSKLAIALASVFSIGCGNDTAPDGLRSDAPPPPHGISSVPMEEAIEPYVARRARLQTQLTRRGPSPQRWSDDPLPAGVQVIEYESDGRKLKAWLSVPEAIADEKKPALVYMHGGFAFGLGDFAVCQPFINAGFVVMCPMFRGENGNPGDFEMMLGEVDDAAAAIRWLAATDFVDPERIYTFGHSSGGVISAVLSLYDDIPVRHGGSAGGLYGVDLFDATARLVPFEPRSKDERRMRVLVGNIAWMKRPHYAFVGREDVLMKASEARAEAASANAPLHVIELPGDHHSSLPDAIERYLGILQQR